MATRRSARSERTPGAPMRRQCGSMEVHQRMLEENPGFRRAQVRLEHAFMARMRAAPDARTTPYKINVVVHVVYKTNDQNISEAQIKSQIAVLNRDFRATNPDRTRTPLPWRGLVSDSMIEFVLKNITRTRTQATSFGTDDAVKSASTGGADPVTPDTVLNIWVCRLRGGLLGYAQFPGGPADTDGVVIRTTAFGRAGNVQPPFHLGRTCTHEVGHYFNLRHIWGDLPNCNGDDLVDDTPGAEAPNSGKPTFPKISCQNGPNGDMFMNYMDYVDDDSMFMFTAGQVARMQTALEGPRSSLIE
jgi:hypothetical protein